MPTNTALIMDRRRNLVASLLRRNPRITRRQIQAALARPVKDGGIRNPDTGRPYSLGTVQADVEAIKEEWREARVKAASAWIEETLATYEELEIQAWRDGDLTEVRHIQKARRELLGLDKPVKIAPTDPSGEQPYEGNVVSVYEHVPDDEV
jgi:membrane peptidoglycan carboxypeptidase